MPIRYQIVKRSQKEYVCDDCQQVISLHSPYKHCAWRAVVTVEVDGKKEPHYVPIKYRLHLDCKAPEEVRAHWRMREEHLADSKARQEALLGRLRAMGFEAGRVWPDGITLSVVALERLFALADKALPEDA